MATILDNEKQNAISSEKSVRSEWNRVTQARGTARESNSIEGEYRVVFVVNDSKIKKRAFDFALHTARRFSSPLVLVYIAPREEVPEDYREFALIEGIRDYEWQYYSWLAGEKLGQLGKRAEEAGVEWTTQVQIGEPQKIVRSLAGDKRTVLVLNPDLERKSRSRMNRLLSRSEHVEPVPILVY